MEDLLTTVEPYFLQWGYWIVFLATLLENAAFIGAVVPGDVVLLVAGFYAELGELSLPTVIGLAFAGGLAGDLIGYTVGRLGGRPLVDRFGGRLLITAERMRRMEHYFARHGGFAVVFGRFAPMIRTVRTLVAGISRMPFWQFLLFDLLGAAMWAAIVPSLGFAFAGSLHAARRVLGTGGFVVLGVLVAAFVLTYRRMKRRLADEVAVGLAAGSAPPPSGEEPAPEVSET